jgi:N-acetylglutamate synthase-like GNAT family acetyltransferase
MGFSTRAAPRTVRPMSELVLRAATRGDLEAIRGLLVDLGYTHLEDEPALDEVLEAVLADPGRGVWLAERAGAIVGLCSLSIRAQLRLAGVLVTIEELVVKDDARGAGIGSALLQLARNEAVRVGARRVELLTNRTRDAYLREFYVKRGFTEVASAVMRWSPTH